MIVQVRGGSGSGKSTLVRQWVEEHQEGHVRHMMSTAYAWNLEHIDCAQSRPFALQFPLENVIVPGHYDAPGGGCDMIKSVSHIYDVVRTANSYRYNVLMEGLFVSKDTKETRALLESFAGLGESRPEVFILLLDVPEADCYQSVMDRRASLGKEPRHLKAHRADWRSAHVSNVPHYEAWQREGLAHFERHSRESAAARVRELLS